MRAHIIYFNFLNPDGEGMSIGGIQTYLTNLIPVLTQCGYSVTIYQRAIQDFYKKFENYDVYGIEQAMNYTPKVARALLNCVLSRLDMSKDLLVYGCETCITRTVPCSTIAIQHGVSWDIPITKKYSPLRYLKRFVGKSLVAWKTIQRIKNVDNLVCVDYNFVNWHKAVSPYPKVRHIVIPNFTVIPTSQPQKEEDCLQIIFARRFVIQRGTRLFANVAERILSEYHDVSITIAGTGPDADYMHDKLDRFDHVQFITFTSQESLEVHQDKDIAVIPTIGSEGTSLSLLEAMASGCAVVCTNVGGMTNIVIDGYNGLMISPEEDELYKALKLLIEDSQTRKLLQNRAYETVASAFSLERWQRRWVDVIHQASDNR